MERDIVKTGLFLDDCVPFKVEMPERSTRRIATTATKQG